MAQLTYKRFAYFITQCVNTIISILKIGVQSRYGVRLPTTDMDRCIVLATGPSLKQSFEKKWELFKTTPLICVNSFAVASEFQELKPMYYVILDPFFWERESDVTKNTFDSLASKTTWKLYLFVPQYALRKKVFVELSKKNSNIELVSYNYTVFKGFPSVAHWFYKKKLAMPQSLSVMAPALFLGVNIGFKEVFLVGADHLWHENVHMSEENILHTKVPHFYENGIEVKYVPFYKSGNPEMGTQKSYEFFDIWSRTFYSYFLINEFAQSVNCKIYNASEVSFIDAFERKQL